MPLVANVSGRLKLHMAWKFSDSTVGLFSDSPKTVRRVPFGSIIDVKFEERMKGNEANPYICCLNAKKRYIAFKLTELSISIWKASEYTLMIQRLKTEKRFSLLVTYLKLLIHSRDFPGFNPDDFYEDGRRKNSEGDQEKEIVELGGSLNELHEFIEKARKSAEVVQELSEIPSKLSGKARELPDASAAVSKGSKYSNQQNKIYSIILIVSYNENS